MTSVLQSLRLLLIFGGVRWYFERRFEIPFREDGPGAGTPDWSPALTKLHDMEDVDPFKWAFKLDGEKYGNNVTKYIELRPPNNGNNCPKNP